ncbi:MAG: MxaK protein [Glaciimonas sp.]|nr:MxaK protein [Glaciimonas sp.]
MRRQTLHVAFGAAALLFTVVALYQGLRLNRALQVNQAIASAEDRVRDGKGSGVPSDAPQAVLARALALSKAGDHDTALKAYNSLIPRGPMDDVGRAALFDLGNMYLRQGIDLGNDGAAASLPMIELAKKRYRDLLRVDPGDWDARYNLERALRLAPEEQEAFAEPENEPVERRRVMLRGMTTEDLP